MEGIVTTGSLADEPDELDGEGKAQDIIESLRQQRREVADVYNKTKILDVPGYNGLLAVEYQYINSEVTEDIARKIRRETKNVNGRGLTLLSAVDTLVAASKRVLIRDKAEGDWIDADGNLAPGVRGIESEPRAQNVGIDNNRPVSLRGTALSKVLKYAADDDRENVMGLFGSEHSVIQTQVLLSNWLTDRSRTADEDFFG